MPIDRKKKEKNDERPVGSMKARKYPIFERTGMITAWIPESLLSQHAVPKQGFVSHGWKKQCWVSDETMWMLCTEARH